MREHDAGSTGISGSLRDVSVADVMQFIHLGRRTGVLRLARGAEHAAIGFHGGNLAIAEAPHTPRVGDMLVSRGLVDRKRLRAALTIQQHDPAHRTLGQILTSLGAVRPESLREVIEDQIKRAVSEVLTWESGTFEFAVGTLRPVDDIVLYTGDVLPEAQINTQMVLLEASRIFDERSRRPASAALPEPPSAPAAPPPQPPPRSAEPPPTDLILTARELQEALAGLGEGGPKPAGDLLELHVLSSDRVLAVRLQQTLHEEVARVDLVGPERVGEAPLGAPPPIVVVDLRGTQGDPTLVAALHRSHPAASLIALADAGQPVARIYEAGALAVVPADVEAVAACVENVIRDRRDLRRGRAAEAGSEVDRLRRVVGDLRSGMMSATTTLNLMHVISESVERAVLFLVKRNELAVLGAFGLDSAGHHLAALTRGLRMSLGHDDALTRAANSGEVQSVTPADANLPEAFGSLLGRPRSGQIVVFPVLGAQRVLAVVYADNGDRDEPIEDLDILELATAQAGVAFENELLRRQISQRHE